LWAAWYSCIPIFYGMVRVVDEYHRVMVVFPAGRSNNYS